MVVEFLSGIGWKSLGRQRRYTYIRLVQVRMWILEIVVRDIAGVF